MDFDINKIIEIVNKKNRLSRLVMMIIGTFLLALCYTSFILPNRIVLGGASGIATILNALLSWNPGIVIFILNTILMIISFIFLGKDQSFKNLFGSIIYPLFISITTPISTHFINMNFSTFIIPLLLMALLYSIASGLIYKSSYTTGGSDIVMQLIRKYKQIQTGKASLITSLIFMAAGGFLFGLDKLIYGILINIISSIIVDKMMIGISANKLFYIHSTKSAQIQKYALSKMNAGITLFQTEGGYSGEKSEMLWCVIPNHQYYNFKEIVLSIDPQAFFVISDCYEVKGGVKSTSKFFN